MPEGALHTPPTGVRQNGPPDTRTFEEAAITTGDDMDRAIRALSTGAALPAEDSGLLADYLEAHTSASIGIDPPKGWLIIDMAAIDAARCVLDDRSSAPNDLVRAAEALRGGTQFPAESSAKLAVLLEKHRALEWPDNAPEQWQKVDHAAQAITQAIIRGLQ